MRLPGAWSPEHAWQLHSSWVFLTAGLHHTSRFFFCFLFFSSSHIFIGDHGEGSSSLSAEVPTVSWAAPSLGRWGPGGLRPCGACFYGLGASAGKACALWPGWSWLRAWWGLSRGRISKASDGEGWNQLRLFGPDISSWGRRRFSRHLGFSSGGPQAFCQLSAWGNLAQSSHTSQFFMYSICTMRFFLDLLLCGALLIWSAICLIA